MRGGSSRGGSSRGGRPSAGGYESRAADTYNNNNYGGRDNNDKSLETNNNAADTPAIASSYAENISSAD
jgi:hypothetical protein